MCHIQKNFINGIDMGIFWCNILHINLVNSCTVFHIQCHSWRCNHVIHCQMGRGLQFFIKTGGTGKYPTLGKPHPFLVYLPNLLHHLKQSWSSWNPICFQRRRHGQTNRLLCPSCICHYQICFHGVKPSFPAFHRCIE